jgi:hypothetical protein
MNAILETAIRREAEFVIYFMLGYAVGVIFHEAGHFVAGRLAGFEIRDVRLGRKFPIFSGMWGSVWFDIRALLFSGHVRYVPLFTYERGRLVAIVLGGPATNLLLLMTFAATAYLAGVSVVENDPLRGLMIAQAVLLVYTLTPFRTAYYFSDGAQLLDLTRAKNGSPTPVALAYENILKTYLNDGAPSFGPESRHVAYYIFTPFRSEDEIVRRDVRACLRALLSRNKLTPAEELLVLDALVTDGLLSPSTLTLDELDRWSEKALRLSPHNRTLIGSRASVLVELGRFEEGRKMLIGAYDDKEVSYDSLMMNTYLALAEHALGNSDGARLLIATAESIAASHFRHLRGKQTLARIEAAKRTIG